MHHISTFRYHRIQQNSLSGANCLIGLGDFDDIIPNDQALPTPSSIPQVRLTKIYSTICNLLLRGMYSKRLSTVSSPFSEASSLLFGSASSRYEETPVGRSG